MKTNLDLESMGLTEYKAALCVPGFNDKQIIIVHDDKEENSYLYIGTVLFTGKKVLCKSDNTRISKKNFDEGIKLDDFIMKSDEWALDYVNELFQNTNLSYIIKEERRSKFYHFIIIKSKEDERNKLIVYCEEEGNDDSYKLKYRRIAYSTEPGEIIYVAQSSDDAVVDIEDICNLEQVSNFSDKDPLSVIKDLKDWSCCKEIFV